MQEEELHRKHLRKNNKGCIMKNPRYQVECPECQLDIWYETEKHVVCPHCGAKLNEQSSEDENEGEFNAS